MIVGLGVDLFDVARMESELRKADPGFTRQLFTRAEIDDCQRQRHPARHFAARFAAKEAIVKALSSNAAFAASWTDIDTCRDGHGRWHVVLHAGARTHAERLGVRRLLVSTALAGDMALASVVLESTP